MTDTSDGFTLPATPPIEPFTPEVCVINDHGECVDPYHDHTGELTAATRPAL